MTSDFNMLMNRLLQQQGVTPPTPATKPTVDGFVSPQGSPRGIRNNNPGNIRDYGSKWQGMTGAEQISNNPNEPGFVTFESPEMGIRALARDLTTKYNRGLDTVEKIVSEYAPPNENDTRAYIKSVVDQTGFKKDEKLKLDEATLLKLVKAKIFHENGQNPYSDKLVTKGVRLAKQ